MAAPTSILVEVDKAEYSRYEPDHNTITATIQCLGTSFAGEQVTVELRKARRNRDAAVAIATVTLTGTAPFTEVVEFHLPSLVDQDEISLIRFGNYFVHAECDDGAGGVVVAESDDFAITIMTVDRLKKDFLFGIDLGATRILEPRFQPKLEGVTVKEVSRNHPIGFGLLRYSYHLTHTANASVDIEGLTVTADQCNSGTAGNALLADVVVPSGTSSLAVDFAGNTLTISLAVNGGVPLVDENRIFRVAQLINELEGFSATFSGTGVDPITAAAVYSFAGGSSTPVRTLSWDGGESVSVKSAGTYILRRGSLSTNNPLSELLGSTLGKDYIIVHVKSAALLPTESFTDELLIEKKQIDDATLARYINEAVSWLEDVALAVRLEPTNVVTSPDPTTIQYTAGVGAPTPIFADADFDFIESPLTYFVGKSNEEWISIKTPYMSLLRVDNLFGAIANTRVIDIDLDWIEFSEKGGLIQLVPFNQEIAFDFIGLIWSTALRGAVALPNFWHFNMIVGLRECPPILQAVIGKLAAIDALTVLGQALSPGVGSTSISRDGVSESISYTTQAQYGAYTGTIAAYKEFIDQELNKFKGKYRGAQMVVV